MSISFSKHLKYPDKILIRTFNGIVNSDDILNSWEELIQQQLLTSNTKGIINDLNNCELNMNMSSFSKVISYMKSQKGIQFIKLAVVTNSPNVIVFPMLMDTNEKMLKIKPFSTFAAAESWILREE
jgi:hypothetical protein